MLIKKIIGPIALSDMKARSRPSVVIKLPGKSIKFLDSTPYEVVYLLH